MQTPRLPADETDRVRTLHHLELLDTPADERFDRLTRIASRLFEVPIALISLIDTDRQWLESTVGVSISETPRSISFCGHTILGKDFFVINDTHLDHRLADNPLVVNDPYIRFYAGRPITAINGQAPGTLCIIDDKPRRLDAADISLLNDLAELAEKEANFPDLKTLNSRLLSSEQELNKARRHRLQLGLMFIDLDRVKQINDTLGHHKGDELRSQVGARLNTRMRDSDTVARLGGDEFTVVAVELDRISDVAYIAQKVLEELAREFLLGREPVFLTASIGIAFYPDHGEDMDKLIDSADRAMYDAKNSGGNRFVIASNS